MVVKDKKDIKIFHNNKKMWENSGDKLVIHHTAFSKKIKPKQFYSVNQWHKQRGFVKHSLGFYVGYNFIIEADGTIMQGRAVGEETAAHRGYNHKYWAVSFSGNYEFETLSDAQIRSFVKLHKWLSEIKGKKLPLVEHNELSKTVCPGKNIKKTDLKKYLEDQEVDPELPRYELLAKIYHIISLLGDMIKLLLKK